MREWLINRSYAECVSNRAKEVLPRVMFRGSVLVAENETLRGLVSAISGLMEGVSTMLKYEHFATLTEIATELAQAKRTSAEDIFKTLASLPQEKVSEMVRKMI